jgi:hypothetical protein
MGRIEIVAQTASQAADFPAASVTRRQSRKACVIGKKLRDLGIRTYGVIRIDSASRTGCGPRLMQRSFGFDVLACPRRGHRLELIALIEEPAVIRRILGHLGLPTEVPAARPARPPPLPIGHAKPRYDDDTAAP